MLHKNERTTVLLRNKRTKFSLMALIAGVALLSASCASLIGVKLSDPRFKGNFSTAGRSTNTSRSGAYYNSYSSSYVFNGSSRFRNHSSSSKTGAYTGHTYASNNYNTYYEIELSEQTPKGGLYRVRKYVNVGFYKWEWEEWTDEWFPYEWSPDGNAVIMGYKISLFADKSDIERAQKYKRSLTLDEMHEKNEAERKGLKWKDPRDEPPPLKYTILEKKYNAEIPAEWNAYGRH
jgi:hypothetical protein